MNRKTVLLKCFKILCCLLFPTFFTSCATILTGTRQDIFFNSEPIGSIVEIDNEKVGETPCTVKLKKNKNYSVVLKQEGYKSSYFFINKEFEPIFLGNLILGGPIGMIVDLCSGAIYKISPTHNFVLMQKNINYQ